MTEAHKLAAARRGAARTEKMEKAVKEAMQAIQADMQANGGIYPHNGGAVSMAELSRRAGISESSFYKKEPENRALKDMANLWLDSLKKKEALYAFRGLTSGEQKAGSARRLGRVVGCCAGTQRRPGRGGVFPGKSPCVGAARSAAATKIPPSC